jgi:hypothetical protein
VLVVLLSAMLFAGAGYEGVRLATSRAAASPHYSIRLTGAMPRVQRSGVPMVLTVTARNTGSAIPDYAVQFVGLEHWILDDVSAGSDPGIIAVGPNPGYAFGPLAAGASITIRLDLAPRNAGRPTLSMTSYPNLDATMHQVATDTPIVNGGVTWSATVTL